MSSSFQVLLFAFIICLLISCAASFRKQSVGVKGTLLCGKKPAANVRVKLMDKDTGRVIIKSFF